LVASLQEVEILRPEGTLVRDVRPMARINISITVEHNGRRESGSSGGGGRHGLVQLTRPENWKPNVIEAIRIAMVNLNAIPAPAGQFDVVLGPGWPGILLHEAIGHGLEGDFNRKKTSAFSGLMGQRIAAKGVTVLDDGTIPDRRGSISFDDEGTQSQKKYPHRRRCACRVHARSAKLSTYGRKAYRKWSSRKLRTCPNASND